MTNRYTIIVMWIACSSAPGFAGDTSGYLEEAVSDADYFLGLERLERFAATEPHLDDSDDCARRTLGTECMSFDARCLSFLQEQPEVARRALPDNSQYWTRYRAVLEVSPISRTTEEVERNLGRGLITAANGWFKRQWLTLGGLAAGEVHFHLMAHRRVARGVPFPDRQDDLPGDDGHHTPAAQRAHGRQRAQPTTTRHPRCSTTC